MRRLILAVAALSALCGCSFTTATGFDECEANTDCAEGRICVEHFCIVNQTPDGCGTVFGKDEAGAIAFGAALPLTPGGSLDQSEQQGLNAITLALGELNTNEGVGGHPFVLHVCDTQGDSEKVKSMSTWLMDEKKVSAIITSGSGQTIAASTETIPRNVLLMTATSTSPAITDLQDTNGGSVGLVWRTAPSDAIQGAVIANLVLTDMTRFASVNKIGIVYLDDPYGQGLSFELNTQLGAKKTLQLFSYKRGGDVTSVVTQLNDFDPDLTILVAFPDDAVKILNAAAATTHLTRADGHNWFFTDSAKDPALLSGLTAPSEVDAALGTAPASGELANSPAYAQFAGNFKSAYGVNPSQYSFTANSYDAMYLLALGSAWATGGGSGEVNGGRIADGLTHMSSGPMIQLSPTQFISAKGQLQAGVSIDVVGTSGKLNFDNVHGEAPARIEVWKVNAAHTGFDTDAVLDPPGG